MLRACDFALCTSSAAKPLLQCASVEFDRLEWPSCSRTVVLPSCSELLSGKTSHTLTHAATCVLCRLLLVRFRVLWHAPLDAQRIPLYWVHACFGSLSAVVSRYISAQETQLFRAATHPVSLKSFYYLLIGHFALCTSSAAKPLLQCASVEFDRLEWPSCSRTVVLPSCSELLSGKTSHTLTHAATCVLCRLLLVRFRVLWHAPLDAQRIPLYWVHACFGSLSAVVSRYISAQETQLFRVNC